MTDYETARESLREAERDLMLQRERVAEMRRNLPTGPVADDYVFHTKQGPTALADLFVDPGKPLVLYHFMFGKAQTSPCSMCAMWADGWNAVAAHLAETVNFALVSSAPIGATQALATEHGWDLLKWVSAADNSFKLDIGGEDATGNQLPFISVWELIDGQPTMSYSGSAHIVGDHWRGVDLLSPVWHLLDLTRPGRGDWMPSLPA